MPSNPSRSSYQWILGEQELLKSELFPAWEAICRSSLFRNHHWVERPRGARHGGPGLRRRGWLTIMAIWSAPSRRPGH